MGGAISKSLVQFSVNGQGCVPSLFSDLRPNNGGGDEDNGTSFKSSHAYSAAHSAPGPAAGLCRHAPVPELLDNHRQVWVSLESLPQ